MVDNTKFIIENVGKEIVQQTNWRMLRSKTNQYKITWFTILSNKNSKFKGNSKLFLQLEYNRKTQLYNLIVRGSLRKWYFGKNVKQDLRKVDLKICLIYLAKELNLPYAQVIKGNITKIELGSTLALNSKYRKFLQGLIFYKRLDRRKVKNSLYFGDKTLIVIALFFMISY